MPRLNPRAWSCRASQGMPCGNSARFHVRLTPASRWAAGGPCQPSSMVIRLYPAAWSPRDFIARAWVSTSASVTDRSYWYQVLYPMTGSCAAASPALRAGRVAVDWTRAGGAAAAPAGAAIAATVTKAAVAVRRDMQRDVPELLLMLAFASGGVFFGVARGRGCQTPAYAGRGSRKGRGG